MTPTKRSSSARPLYRTPDPTSVPGAWFDQEAVDRVCRFASKCRHTKGRWDRRPIVFDDWQLEHFIAPVFGWKHPPTDDHPRGLRIRRSAWLEVPKKNGKSTIASVLGLYLAGADHEGGAEVYAAASDKEQARLVFEPATTMVNRSPVLKKHYRPFVNTITVPRRGSFFRVISSAPRGKHGFNIHGCIVDEVHVHENRDLIDALDYGTAAREQPLMIYITTAGEDDDESIYAEKHDQVIAIAEGRVDDPTFFGVIFAAAEDDDPFAVATWKRANPALGRTLKIDYLESKAVEARTSPKKLKQFRRLHTNVRQASSVKPIEMKRWDASKGPKWGEGDLAGEKCFGGLDVGRSMEVAAFALDFPVADAHRVLWRFWLPKDWFASLDDETKGAASKWLKAGSLRLTEGDVIDYEAIEKEILEDAERFDVEEIAFNRRGARQLAQRLETNGITMVQMAPGITLAPAMQELERLVLKKLYHHRGDVVARAMVDKLIVRTDTSGNAWPDKGKSKGNISGPMAAVMALDRATTYLDAEQELSEEAVW